MMYIAQIRHVIFQANKIYQTTNKAQQANKIYQTTNKAQQANKIYQTTNKAQQANKKAHQATSKTFQRNSNS